MNPSNPAFRAISLPALILLLITAGVSAQTTNAPDIVIADFEGPDYGAWTTDGAVFGTSPAQGARPGQQPVTGFEGHGLVNSFGNDGEGALLSPEFTIERGYINFLIGGGHLPGQAFVALMVDGKAVRGATGARSHALTWAHWDVKDLQGKKARIRIVDRAIEHWWGYISVDQIVQSDEPRGDARTDTNDAKDWVISTSEPYNESFRPQFHFSAESHWLNDPNGLIFHRGEYHLCFQHISPTTKGTAWGHAISTDLLHWKQQPHAILPDDLGDVFSGSAVVDWNNTAGFQSGEEKALVAIYTSAPNPAMRAKGQLDVQCLAYSNDRGRTWTKYSGNPVLKNVVNGNRDPKVIWHEPSKRWIMALYLGPEQPNAPLVFALFSSPDLKQWTQLQTLVPGGAECPDFFPMPVAGKPGVTKWVFTVANGSYTVGDFDGTTFKPDGKSRPLQVGGYAVQTFSDIPEKDGRRIQVAWMSGTKSPKMPFENQMSFPCVLTLHEEGGAYVLHRYPVSEIECLRVKSLLGVKDQPLAPGANPLADVKGDLLDIDAEFAVGDAKEIVFTIRGQTVKYEVPNHILRVNDGVAPLPLPDDRLKVRILVDRTTLEVFGNDGQATLTGFFNADPDLKDLSLTASGGTAKIVKLDVHELKSVWKTQGQEAPK